MRRRLLLLAACVPFVLVAISFAHSFTGPHGIMWTAGRRYSLNIHRGTVQFGIWQRLKVIGVTPNGFATEEMESDEPAHLVRRPLPVLRTPQWPPIGHARAQFNIMLAAIPVIERCEVTSIAHWPLMIATSLPIWWWGLIERRRHLASRRRAAGLCPRCGYDMRASPDRCPECGFTQSP